MDYQYYPTPAALARKAWAKFKNRDFSRVLEPSAGEGHLAEHAPGQFGYHRSRIAIDVIEIDPAHHPALKGKGMNLVGIDFLGFESGSIYSHVIMNPPFAEGARHVLHAWDILYDGEIVAILNAETLRNPYTWERKRLVDLIQAHGEVEYITEAFSVPEALRKTSTEIALVYLRKVGDVGDLFADTTQGLKRDAAPHVEDPSFGTLALPNNFVQNQVLAFRAAVEALKEATIAQVRAERFAARIGQPLAVLNGDAKEQAKQDAAGTVRERFARGYDDLKDRAWASILRSTEVESRLSSRGQALLEKGFEEIKHLEFTEANIYGFLAGLASKQGEIQIEMACDVFDLITRYHSDNTVFYLGWKSNDQHYVGMKIRAKRFILPGFSTDGWRNSLPYDGRRRLEDIDRVFAMLDGKREPEKGIVHTFEQHWQALVQGGRVASDYFELRYYPGRGTIHFFPMRPDLIDRLNRLVGRHRQWLPEDSSMANEDFWKQYEQAEGFDKALRERVKDAKFPRCYWGSALDHINSGNESIRLKAQAFVSDELESLLREHGLDVVRSLEAKSSAPQLQLLAA